MLIVTTENITGKELEMYASLAIMQSTAEVMAYGTAVPCSYGIYG